MHTSNAQLNPLNYIPSNLSQSPADDQQAPLSKDRVISSIPRSHNSTSPLTDPLSSASSPPHHASDPYLDPNSDKWIYPSPQMFFNALRRKGKDAPEEYIQVMVDIHNFLNEECWKKIEEWEKPHQE
jgi:cytochrome c heme-lyase